MLPKDKIFSLKMKNLNSELPRIRKNIFQFRKKENPKPSMMKNKDPPCHLHQQNKEYYVKFKPCI